MTYQENGRLLVDVPDEHLLTEYWQQAKDESEWWTQALREAEAEVVGRMQYRGLTSWAIGRYRCRLVGDKLEIAKGE